MSRYQPVYSTPVLETEYAKELFQDLREARKLAQQNIKKAQHQQKKNYDKLLQWKVDYLVMLKVEPRFKLDRTYKGPYRVIVWHSQTRRALRDGSGLLHRQYL